MADTKISALTTDTAPDNAADYVPTYNASDATKSYKVLLSKLGGFSLSTDSNAANPVDGTSYYFGGFAQGYGAAANNKIYIPRACKLVKARIFLTGANGTSETSTMSFRLNDTTNTTISSTVACNAFPYTSVNSALAVALAEDDYFSILWVTPTWVTNPTSVSVSVQMWFV